MQRVANCVVEVRDGKVANYPGDYANYVYRVGKEITDGARDHTHKSGVAPPPRLTGSKDASKTDAQLHRERKKEISALERRIAKLDETKKQIQARLMEAADAASARKLHDEFVAATKELDEAELRWLELQD
jgi:ATP-binding cassette subfamily F protein 3